MNRLEKSQFSGGCLGVSRPTSAVWLCERRLRLVMAMLMVCAAGCTPTENVESPRSRFERLRVGLEEVPVGERSKYAERSLGFADSVDDDQISVETLLWITRTNARSVGFKEANDQAIDRLVDQFLDRPETATAVFEMRNARSPKTIGNLKRLVESKNDRIRGLATFSLAVRTKARDKSEAISLLERVVQDYPDLSISKKERMLAVRTLAEKYLFELRNMGIGMVAPQTNGVDLDGVNFSLADYRGKVVLLSFWADW